MAPPGSRLDVKHRIRRANPMRIAMRRSLARLGAADADAISRFQERRLRALVRLAGARSPFYRDWFRTNAIDPRDIRTLDDLSRLPLLDRSHLAERPDDFRVYPRRLMWSARSSGTSGGTVQVFRTPGSSTYELAALDRQWSWFGLPRDARKVILRGSDFAADAEGSPTKSLPGANQLLVSSFHLTDENMPEILEHIRAFDPQAIEGWPSSMALLASLLRDRDETLPVRAVVTSSEVMSPGQRALFRDIFRGPIVDHYGQTERVAMAGGCEHNGFHTFDDYGIVELLPVDGTSDRWEIVGTPLHNWGFPLFRYRTGDEVGPALPGPCPCGRAFGLLGAIDGRVEDSFTATDGRLLPLPSTVVDDLAGLREAQIAQLSPGRFEVRVVPGPRYDAAATAAQVRRNVDRLFGVDEQVSVREMNTLPRPASGKLKTAVVEKD